MLSVLDRVRSSPCFGLLTDLSSDISNHEVMLLYARHFDITTMSPATSFLCSVRLLGKDAQSIFNAIECISSTLDLNIREKLVAFCADGDNSMQGWRQGVLGRLRQHCNSVFGVHCAAHRHVLAVSDVGVKDHMLRGLDSLLTAAHTMFSRKPKRFGQWESFAKQYGLTAFKFPSFNETRWWSRGAGVFMLIRSYPVLMKYLELLCRPTSSVLWGGGLPVYMRLKRLSDVLVLFALGDLLACLEPCRRLFEADNALLSDVRSNITRLLGSLSTIFPEDIHSCSGKYMKLLLAQTQNLTIYNGVVKFEQKGITVHITVDQPVKQIYGGVQKIAQQMISSLQDRFPTKEMDILECFQVLEFQSYESMSQAPMHEVDEYGTQELTQLLDHLSNTQYQNGFYCKKPFIAGTVLVMLYIADKFGCR